MIVPALLPDELAEGYCGRIQILNCINSERATLLQLGAYLHGEESAKALELLAIAAGISFEQIVKKHTLIPFTHAYGGTAGRRTPQDHLKFHELDFKWIKKKDAYVCLECIKEDLISRGFSYWRRTHQLPGINWCVKHATPLFKKLDKSIFTEMPANGAELVGLFDVRYVAKAMANIFVQRYVEICCDYLEQERPYNTLAFSRKLRGKPSTYRTSCRFTANDLELGERANKMFPRRWLLNNFPQVAIAKPGSHIWSLDGLVSASHNYFATENYALAAAIIFKDGLHRDVESGKKSQWIG